MYRDSYEHLQAVHDALTKYRNMAKDAAKIYAFGILESIRGADVIRKSKRGKK